MPRHAWVEDVQMWLVAVCHIPGYQSRHVLDRIDVALCDRRAEALNAVRVIRSRERVEIIEERCRIRRSRKMLRNLALDVVIS